MDIETWAGGFLVLAPIWFNVTFALLAKRFDYPDILRRPTDEILQRFHEGGPSLILQWWAFMLSGLLMIGAVVLLSATLGFSPIVVLATTIGTLAGLVQMLGLLRWVYLVPSLARSAGDPNTSQAQRDADAAVFRAFHQYLGVGVGEHLGYLFTGLWSVLIGVAVLSSEMVPSWLSIPGIAIGLGLMISSAEFLGPNEEKGWKFAGAIVPFLYIAWSAWLVALGVFLIV